MTRDSSHPAGPGSPTLRTPPGPEPLVELGESEYPLPFLAGLIDRYGDTVRYVSRYGPCFLFTRPEHVRAILHDENYRRAALVKLMLGEGLLASEGTFWREQRRLMQPQFHVEPITRFLSLMNDEATRLVAKWDQLADRAEPVDAMEAMTHLTLRVVVRALFSDDLPAEHANGLCRAITGAIEDIGALSWTVFGADLQFTPTRNAEFAAHRAVVDEICHEQIARRRRTRDRPRDLLTLLIEGHAAHGPLDDDQIRDEMVTMLVGGHETTALALAWAWKLLAEHPDARERMETEIDAVLGDRDPVLEDLPRLRWTRAVFHEVMRLYPPVWYMARVAERDGAVGDCRVPAGACVLVTQWFTHRHPEYWPNPERFDPERFVESVESGAHRYAYFPFGGGRHLCMGVHFARMEGVVMLARLARRFRVEPVRGQRIRPLPGITLRQRPHLQVLIESRVAADVTVRTADDGTVRGPAAAGSTATRTLASCVRDRSQTHGDSTAYVFLADGERDERCLSWAQLDRKAGAIAAALRDHGGAGRHVLLALPSGLRFIEALFGCWYAGAVAVPICLPRHHRAVQRLHATVADADVALALSATDTLQWLHADGADDPLGQPLGWIDVDTIPDDGAAAETPATLDGDALALLQYTSGSTGSPKGVMVTHANLMHNSGLIAAACGHEAGHTIAGWLPLFHDMGLIGLVLQAAFVGARCVLMTPERFLMRPVRWLEAMTRYGARSSPAPNMAYELCAAKVTDTQKASLDLGAWRAALNGSEPVRAATVDRFARTFEPCGFRRDAFYPCYGLAEATLFVTGPTLGSPLRVEKPEPAAEEGPDYVGCGRSWHDQRIAIVDPADARRCPPGTVGEIWVAGPSCAAGYWNDAGATRVVFGVHLEDGDGPWLRTGDLGFLRDGELFVTGRLRDLIIAAGRNHFPEDLEQTVEAAHPGVIGSSAAAFAVEVDGGEALVVTAEVARGAGPKTGGSATEATRDEIVRGIRSALVAGHELAPHDVVLLARGATPRTTSGKIRRGTCRQLYLGGELRRLQAGAGGRS